MQVTKIHQTQNFNGNMTRKAVGFLLDNTQHFFVQGTSFFLAHKLVHPIDNLETFMQAKIMIDIGEYLSLLTNKSKCTNEKQCTNIVVSLLDCTKDVIRWTSKLIEKISKN